MRQQLVQVWWILLGSLLHCSFGCQVGCSKHCCWPFSSVTPAAHFLSSSLTIFYPFLFLLFFVQKTVFLYYRFCVPQWQSLQVLRYIEGLGRAVDFQLLSVILKTELRVKWAGFKLWKKRLYSHCKDARQSPHIFFLSLVFNSNMNSRLC